MTKIFLINTFNNIFNDHYEYYLIVLDILDDHFKLEILFEVKM